jgi:hypothetical protein
LNIKQERMLILNLDETKTILTLPFVFQKESQFLRI